MKQQLKDKQVVLKLNVNTPAIIGMVYEVEDDGIWIQPSAEVAGMGLKHPLMFVPFCQMLWLATQMTAQQLTGQRPT
jgi:hypothetical protein